MQQPRTWTLDRSVRADAPGIYVSADDLPGAAIGERVICRDEHESVEDRTAVVAAVEDRHDGTYLRLDFDSPR